MRRLFIIPFLMLAYVAICQPPLYEHRGVQYATHGTDFWFSLPRTLGGISNNHACLYIMAEHNCRVTISNPIYDYAYTKNIISCHEINSRLDTLNFIELPWSFISCIDTLCHYTPNTREPAYGSQKKGFHITSTDTISVFLFSYSNGNIGVTNVLPTEMLRDEYIIQSYPDHGADSIFRPQGAEEKVNMGDNAGFFEIVATEDSTVVDIELSDRDWMDRTQDSVITIVLNRGMMFHDKVGLWRHDYPDCCIFDPPNYPPQTPECTTQPVIAHRFPVDTSIELLLYTKDLSGTHIKARDNKRIAVFQGNQMGHVNFRGYADFMFEQAMPIRYAGTEFLVPNLVSSKDDYIHFTGLVDGTTITITSPMHTPVLTHTTTINARASYWFVIDSGYGPYYITATHPILTSVSSCGLQDNYCVNNISRGDPATVVVVPVEWWHNGPANGSPVYWVDENHNGWSYYHSVHLFTRTADVGGMFFNRTPIDTLFHPIPGTPYSYALIRDDSPLNQRLAHRVENRMGGAFWAVADAAKDGEHSLYSYSHLQPGKNYLEVNGIPAESLRSDSIWCMYDPILFHGWVERPADSIIWDFGDGNVERYRYEDGQWVTHTYTDTGRYAVRRIIKYMDEALDTQWGYLACKSVFTRPSDTMCVSIWVHNHYDSAFAVTVCEGSFTFRGHVLETTDTHYVTTYWTESGCDTLWQIDLITCPHCSFRADTISDEQLPWYFNGISFAHEVRHYPIYIDIGDECDSVIDYYLIVIPHWGEPIDSSFVLAPNIITPNGDIDINRRFHLFCSEDVVAAEVYIFDRMGRRLAHFNGLKEDWDGTYDGKPLPQGSYAYYVRYIDGSNRNWKTMAGTFTIIR